MKSRPSWAGLLRTGEKMGDEVSAAGAESSSVEFKLVSCFLEAFGRKLAIR